MTREAQYAQALFELVEAHPDKGHEYLKNLELSLKARGHQKLLPKIFSQYRGLHEHKKRSKGYRQAAEQDTQTRMLVELYRTLIAS